MMFKLTMLLNGTIDLALYRAFPMFLEKSTLLWFSYFLARSLNNFSRLSQVFVNQFSSSQIYTKTANALNPVKQGQNESLSGYLTYNTVAMEIPYLDPPIEMYSIKNRLKPRPFMDSLAINC